MVRKSTAIIVTLFFAAPLLHAEVATENQDSSRMAHVPGHPMIAMSGMMPVAQPAVTQRAAEIPPEIIYYVTNYPNPFDSRKPGMEGQTVIAYNLAQDSKVSITMYDLLGNNVQEWNFRPGSPGGQAGPNQINWDGTNAAHQKVSKGGYIAEIEVETSKGSATVIRKIGVIH